MKRHVVVTCMTGIGNCHVNIITTVQLLQTTMTTSIQCWKKRFLSQ